MVKYKTKEQVLNAATQIIINRWDDGLIDNIIAMKGTLAIHKSQAVYRLLNGQKVLNFTDGFFGQEILNQQPLDINIKNPMIGRVQSEERQFVERWEYLSDLANRRWMFFNRYTGRSFPLSPVWASECGRPLESWHLPNILLRQTSSGDYLGTGVSSNVIDMTNSVDGVTPDEIYIQPRVTFTPPVVMATIIKFPDPDTL